MNTVISKKEERFRAFSLNAPVWQVVLSVSFPLALYQSLNQLFKILDSVMAAYISPSAVSAVAYLSQINMTFSALGGGLAVGASIKVSEAYGAGDFDLVKRQVSTMFALCALLGCGLLLILAPNITGFLKLMNTPEEFIKEGRTYFILELFGLVVTFFNNVYIAIERARGNSGRIFWLNLVIILVKLGLTGWFVYGLGGGMNMISAATLISQGLLLLAAVVNLNQQGSAFRFCFKSVSFRKTVIAPMLNLSFPVIVEKIAFSLGKVVVNSMSTAYGALTVGALGISNNIGGVTTNPQNGFQEGVSAVISQNLGGKKPRRAVGAFWWALLMNLILSAGLTALSLLLIRPLSILFAGDDGDFANMITTIFRYEALGAIPLGANAAVMGLLYGFGRTKVTLFMNFCRVFVFRIPVLWALQQFTDLGSASAGIVMAVSNVCSGLLALLILPVELYRIHREYGLSNFHPLALPHLRSLWQ